MTSVPSEVVVYQDAEDLASGAAARIADHLREAIGRRGQVSFVLSGGSTPLAAYRRLAREELPWDRIELYWGDERCVAPEDPASNYGRARATLLGPARVPERVIHRIRGELGPAVAATDYERRLRSRFPDSRPAFDLVLLGIGDDGHTASLFPGDEIDSPGHWVIPARAPQPPHERVSLSYEALGGASRIFFLVSGETKAAMVDRILGTSDAALPAARVAREARAVSWLLDREAARGRAGGEIA